MKKYKGSSKVASNASKTLKPVYDYSDDDDIYTDEDDFYSDEESPDYYSSAVSGKTGGYFHHHPSAGNKKSDYYHGTSGGNKHKGLKEPAYKVNKYQTIVLKVQVHCDACIKKVKKAIAKIDGVESISVDARQKKVSVTGYIDPKKLLKKVAKTGKHVELVGSITNAMVINGGYPANTNKATMFLPYEHRQTTAVINNNKAYSNAIANMDLATKSTKQHSHHHHHPLPFSANTDGRMFVMQNPPPYNDVGFIFSDDNVNNCSIM